MAGGMPEAGRVTTLELFFDLEDEVEEELEVDPRALLRPRLRLHDHAADGGSLPRADAALARPGRAHARRDLVDVRRLRVDDERRQRAHGDPPAAPARRDGRLLRPRALDPTGVLE